MNSAEITQLFTIARASLEAAVNRSKYVPEDMSAFPTLMDHRGAFVTLYNGENLRGCVGHIYDDQPLFKSVAEMSAAAATFDPRFPSVLPAELPDIHIEISVLSPFEIITDFSTIEIGVHGLLIERGESRGLLLPQVAPRYQWNPEEFLGETCMKAMLPRNAYKQEGIKISVFTAEVLTETNSLTNE